MHGPEINIIMEQLLPIGKKKKNLCVFGKVHMGERVHVNTHR